MSIYNIQSFSRAGQNWRPIISWVRMRIRNPFEPLHGLCISVRHKWNALWNIPLNKRMRKFSCHQGMWRSITVIRCNEKKWLILLVLYVKFSWYPHICRLSYKFKLFFFMLWVWKTSLLLVIRFVLKSDVPSPPFVYGGVVISHYLWRHRRRRRRHCHMFKKSFILSLFKSWVYCTYYNDTR